MEYPNINIFSKNPFTAEGIKYFLESNIPAEINIITMHGNKSINQAKGNLSYCNISFINNKHGTIPSDRREATSILLIDDYDIHFTDEFEPRGTKGVLFFIEDIFKTYRSSEAGKLKTKFLIYTGNNNITYLKHLKDSRKTGILHKTSPKEKLLKAVEKINSGKLYVDPRINRLISEYRKYIVDHPFQKLTCRQLEILEYISKGYRSNKIAEKLFVSVSTVEKHRNNIKERIDVKTAEELRELAVNNKNEILFLLKFYDNNGKI